MALIRNMFKYNDLQLYSKNVHNKDDNGSKKSDYVSMAGLIGKKYFLPYIT